MGSLCTNYGTRWIRKNSVKKKNAFPVSPLCAPCQTRHRYSRQQKSTLPGKHVPDKKLFSGKHVTDFLDLCQKIISKKP
jgi:hypothetical protein